MSTSHVFYVGKGRGRRHNRTNKRNELFYSYYNYYECDNRILIDGLDEETAFQLEAMLISVYKKLGCTDANIRPGGYGGDVISSLPPDKKEAFLKKMTEINRKRCATEEFRNNARQNMIKRYENPEAHVLQSIKEKAAWSNKELRERHSKNQKEFYKQHPEIAKNRVKVLMKPCVFELNGEIIEFESEKQAEAYIHEKLDFHPSRKTLQHLLYSKAAYVSVRKTTNHVDGMKLYYKSVETIENANKHE